MAPLAAFTGLGMAFALVQQKFLTGIAMLLMLLMMFLGGILGLICVWVSLLIPAEKFVHRRLRIGIACGIAIGIADGLYWLATLRSEVGSFGPSSWSMWLLMLVGPMVVGMHHLQADPDAQRTS